MMFDMLRSSAAAVRALNRSRRFVQSHDSAKPRQAAPAAQFVRLRSLSLLILN
jgi:hypothetical protein